jgi:hypothetical protein
MRAKECSADDTCAESDFTAEGFDYEDGGRATVAENAHPVLLMSCCYQRCVVI